MRYLDWWEYGIGSIWDPKEEVIDEDEIGEAEVYEDE